MDRRRTGLLLATSGTLAGALLARRARLGGQPAPGPATESTAEPAAREASHRRPRSFGWRSHAPMQGVAARSRVRVRAGAPAGIFAPANPHPES
ncbi:MAG: hypothetical protein ACTHOD_07170 [Motilibacteraceae bacterium]